MGRQLVGGIQRTFADHRRSTARRFRKIVDPVVADFGGTIPPHARITLTLYGRLALDLERLADELDAALKRRRMRDARRLRRQIAGSTHALMRLRDDLDKMVTEHRSSCGPLGWLTEYASQDALA